MIANGPAGAKPRGAASRRASFSKARDGGTSRALRRLINKRAHQLAQRAYREYVAAMLEEIEAGAMPPEITPFWEPDR